jgi:hypothetical protein
MATTMFRYDPDLAGAVINWPHGSGTAIQDCGTANPDPKEICMDILENWELTCLVAKVSL